MAYTTIDDPSLYFQTTLYTGSGSSTQNVVNGGNSDLQPDWVWVKNRTDARWHRFIDSSRGASKNLYSNEDDAEGTETSVTAFNSDGFSLGTDTGSDGWNENSDAHVAWQWKVNGGTTTSFSESGSQIGGARQVNTTAGISLITYTGNGSSGSTIPHGLSQTPEYVMVKNRGDADEWVSNGSVLGNYARLHPNATSELATGEGSHDYIKYPNTGSTNLVTGVAHNRSNADGDTYMAWCFHSVQGYSKIGKYTGNGNADGPFIYTGFKPSLIIRKVTSASGGWLIQDSTRTTFNGLNSTTNALRPNSNEAEFDYFDIDYLSNGFKIRTTEANHNVSGGTFMYMAFAESPFVSSEGVPTTAR